MRLWGDGAPNLEGPVDYIERIADMGACAPAMAWLRSEQYPTLQAAWDACPRGDWMLWLLSTMDHPAYPTAYAAAAIRAVVPVAPVLP